MGRRRARRTEEEIRAYGESPAFKAMAWQFVAEVITDRAKPTENDYYLALYLASVTLAALTRLHASELGISQDEATPKVAEFVENQRRMYGSLAAERAAGPDSTGGT
jgi:hypothetical protein